MQSWRLPLILISICVLALGYVIFYERHQLGTSETLFLEKRLFPSFNPEEAHRITARISKSQDLRLSLSGNRWRIEEPFTFAADPFAVDDLLWLITDLEYIQKIPVVKDSSRLQDYGLNEPRVVMRANWGRKDEIELRIGAESPRPNSIYVQIRKNDGFVYVIPSEVHFLLSQPADSWRNKILINLGDEQIKSIVLESRGLRHEIRETHSQWNLISPESAALDADKVHAWLVAILSSRVEGYGDDSQQDIARRIEPESLQIIELFNGSGDLISGLRFATTTTPQGQQISVVRRVGENIWMILSDEQKEILSPNVDMWRDKKLTRVAPSTVKKLAISGRNTDFALLRHSTGWRIPEYPYKVDSIAIEDFLTFLSEISLGETYSGTISNDADIFLTIELWQELEDGEDIIAQKIKIFKTQDDIFLVENDNSSRPSLIEKDVLRKLLVEPSDFREKKLRWQNITEATYLKITSSSGKEVIWDRTNPNIGKLLALFDSIDVSQWLDIKECPPGASPHITVTATFQHFKQSQLLICLCETRLCGMILSGTFDEESFQPENAWFALLIGLLTEEIKHTQTEEIHNSSP